MKNTPVFSILKKHQVTGRKKIFILIYIYISTYIYIYLKKTYTIYDFLIQANLTKVFRAFNKTSRQRKKNVIKNLAFVNESGLANSTNRKYFHG